jgi:nicotinate-nucleotide adenylyltransferase
MKTLLYGSPFDPVHHGHLGIVQHVKKQGQFDKVILIVTKYPRWKSTMTPVNHRIEMLKLALKDQPEVELCLYEVESEATINFSIDTVAYLKTKYPQDAFSFLIGSDQVTQLHKWKDIDRLSQLVQWLSYPRGQQTIRTNNINRYHVRMIEGPLLNVSSTAIRELQSLQTPYLVIQYILDHELYFVPRLKSFYSQKRWNHVVSVAQVAYHIARKNGFDGSLAMLASLLHDIAKDFSKEEQLKRFKTDYPDMDRPYFSLHQFVGASVAKQEFHVVDPLVLNAIACHSTGKKEMTWLDMIVYAADKIEPLRGYDSTHLIKLCETNYLEGFKKVLRENVEYHQLKNEKPMGEDMVSCIQQYLGDNDHEKSK